MAYSFLPKPSSQTGAHLQVNKLHLLSIAAWENVCHENVLGISVGGGKEGLKIAFGLWLGDWSGVRFTVN